MQDHGSAGLLSWRISLLLLCFSGKNNAYMVLVLVVAIRVIEVSLIFNNFPSLSSNGVVTQVCLEHGRISLSFFRTSFH